ncbi:MAG: hypothetical protein WBQ68_07165 [Terriglobales bacterium]
MSEILKGVRTSQSSESEKYFSFHIKGWTNFDPMNTTLAQIAERIERGDGFLTLVEVLRVEEKVTFIDDEEAKKWFENLLAARRLIQNVNELPANVREELRAALKNDEEIVPNKIVTLEPPAPLVNEETAARVKRFP